jgi:hypothetical protein
MPGFKWRVPALPVLTAQKAAPLRFSEPTIFASACSEIRHTGHDGISVLWHGSIADLPAG